MTWIPKDVGVYPFYCTDFCSALHQEMSGYIRVSPAGSMVALTANISPKARAQVSGGAGGNEGSRAKGNR
jgi:nitrous-oxide reductase